MRARWLARLLRDRLIEGVAERRAPDRVIKPTGEDYLRRWYLIPRNRWFNIYLHHFLRSDEDRALHDHPWVSCSFLLHGSYEEVVAVDRDRPEGARTPLLRQAGDIVFRRSGKAGAHRVQLLPSTYFGTITGERPVWTLFLTGPVVRPWGFYCPKGFVNWKDFTDASGNGIGKGCGE